MFGIQTVHLHLFNQRSDDDMKSTDKILPFEAELNKIFDEAKIQTDVQKEKSCIIDIKR